MPPTMMQRRSPKKALLPDPYVAPPYTSPPLSSPSKAYVPLPLMGQIKEKGFAPASQEEEMPQPKTLSLPQPRVTPFPIARHRSEGPHWAPALYQPFNASEKDKDDSCVEAQVNEAEPLKFQRKPKLVFDKPKKHQGGTNMQDEASCKTDFLDKCADDSEEGKEDLQSLGIKTDYVASKETVSDSEKPTQNVTTIFAMNELGSFIDNLEARKLFGQACRTGDPSSVKEGKNTDYSLANKILDGGTERSLITNVSASEEKEGLEAQNLATLSLMTSTEIEEAQAELRERLRPDILDMLKRRGMNKVKRDSQDGEPKEFSTKRSLGLAPDDHVVGKSMSTPSSHDQVKGDCNTNNTLEGVSAPCGLPSSSINSSENAAFTDSKRPWTARVEAARLLKFDLEGNIIYSGLITEEDNLKKSQWNLDNVTERDIVRTDGNPVGEGYSIKECVALARSLVPGQRAVAVRMIALLLEKSIVGYQTSQISNHVIQKSAFDDWQAVWAYALGPEVELLLTLRVALDDAYATVVATSARALQSLLSCSANEYYFHLCEAFGQDSRNLYTAPILRKVTNQDEGFITGGCWEYNVSPSQLLPFSDKSTSEKNGATVADDAAIANQDVAAGLIRMGVLPRIRYILEVERLALAEEYLLNVLIALSRHSPSAADAVIKCPMLIDTVGKILMQNKDTAGAWPVKIKAVQLLLVLSQARKSNCERFLKMGIFQAAVADLFQQGVVKDHVSTNLQTEIVQALRFWKVCIQYSLVSSFPDALRLWISPPSASELESLNISMANVVLARDSYIMLGNLAGTLPFLSDETKIVHQGRRPLDSERYAFATSSWSWNIAIPLVETSIGWFSSAFISLLTQKMQQLNKDKLDHSLLEKEIGDLMGVLGSVLYFLRAVCERVVLDEGSFNICSKKDSPSSELELKCLPTFVPHLQFQLLKSGIFTHMRDNAEVGVSFFPKAQTSMMACFLSLKETLSDETVLAGVNVLNWLLSLMRMVDSLLEMGKCSVPSSDLIDAYESFETNQLLKEKLVRFFQSELLALLSDIGCNIIRDSCIFQLTESSGRGGPAPGVGVGWGCLGGGFWSMNCFKAQMNLQVCTSLFEFFAWKPGKEANFEEQSLTFQTWLINLGLIATILAGPGDVNVVKRIFSSVVLHLDTVTLLLKETQKILGNLLHKRDGSQKMQAIFTLEPQEMKKVLQDHFENVWLQKINLEVTEGQTKGKNEDRKPLLATVYEEPKLLGPHISAESLLIEWAAQKLPLPLHWFLSPLISCIKHASGEVGIRDFSTCWGQTGRAGKESLGKLKLVQCGLVLLAGLEALADKYEDKQHLAIQRLPFVWKLHALSTVFLLEDDVFLDGVVREIIGSLQMMYGNLLDQHFFGSQFAYESAACMNNWHSQHCSGGNSCQYRLDFETIVDQRYSNFVECLVKQFAAVSFGDNVFGRQIALYLRRDVEDALRLKAWITLAEEHVLGLLPPLEQCCGSYMAYLYPSEENHDILKAYVASWSGGALEKAINLSSITFSLSMHHIVAFLFKEDDQQETTILRKEFARNLIRASIRRRYLQGPFLRLLKYDPQRFGEAELSKSPVMELESRFAFLEEACKGYEDLNVQLQQLRGLLFADK